MNSPKEIYQVAIQKWGASAQVLMAIEEMGELTQQLSKHLNGRGNDWDICDEIADVGIMLEQLFLIFDGGLIRKRRDFKLGRLRKKLSPEESR